MLQKDLQAPDFKLFNAEKKEMTLADFKGKNLVILFFPAAFTSVCTAELCHIRDNYAIYNGLNAEVIGISVDSPFTLAKFKEEQQLTFNLLSDFNKTTAAAYGILRENFVFGMKGVAERASFVLDGDGVVQHVEILASPGDMPNFEAIQAALKTEKKKLIDDIKLLTDGLLYLSESEFPFEAKALGNDKTAALQQLGIDENKAKQNTVEKFFEKLTTPQDWHSDADKINLSRFVALRDFVLTNWKETTVYKQGATEIDIHIVGQADQFYSLSTKAIET